MKRRTLVRLAFLAAVLVLFPLQILVEAELGEPYPALRMPAFPGGGGGVEEHLSRRSATASVKFAEGDRVRFPATRLVEHLPRAHRRPILQLAFRPASERSPPPAEFVPPDFGDAGALERLGKRLLPGYVIAFRRRNHELRVPPETVAWLRRRIAAMFPGRRARTVTFRWSETDYTLSGRPAPSGRTPLGELSVPL